MVKFHMGSWLITIIALIFFAFFSKIVSISSNEKTIKNVDPKSLKLGPVRHKLEKIQVDRISSAHKILSEVDRSSLEICLENFSRDTNPDDEIKIYEAMALAFEKFTASRSLNLEQKEEAFNLLMRRSFVPLEQVIASHTFKTLTNEDAIQLLNWYSEPPSPVKVIFPKNGVVK